MDRLYDLRVLKFLDTASPELLAPFLSAFYLASGTWARGQSGELFIHRVRGTAFSRRIERRYHEASDLQSEFADLWAEDVNCGRFDVQATWSTGGEEQEWVIVYARHRIPLICALRRESQGPVGDIHGVMAGLLGSTCGDVVCTELVRNGGLVVGEVTWLYLEGKLRRLDDPCGWPGHITTVVSKQSMRDSFEALRRAFQEGGDLSAMQEVPMRGRAATAFLRSADAKLLANLGEDSVGRIVASMGFSMDAWLRAA